MFSNAYKLESIYLGWIHITYSMDSCKVNNIGTRQVWDSVEFSNPDNSTCDALFKVLICKFGEAML